MTSSYQTGRPAWRSWAEEVSGFVAWTIDPPSLAPCYLTAVTAALPPHPPTHAGPQTLWGYQLATLQTAKAGLSAGIGADCPQKCLVRQAGWVGAGDGEGQMHCATTQAFKPEQYQRGCSALSTANCRTGLSITCEHWCLTRCTAVWNTGTCQPRHVSVPRTGWRTPACVDTLGLVTHIAHVSVRCPLHCRTVH